MTEVKCLTQEQLKEALAKARDGFFQNIDALLAEAEDDERRRAYLLARDLVPVLWKHLDEHALPFDRDRLTEFAEAISPRAVAVAVNAMLFSITPTPQMVEAAIAFNDAFVDQFLRAAEIQAERAPPRSVQPN
jgi:hypothetical protein